MRSIVFAVATSACYHYAIDRAPTPSVEVTPQDDPDSQVAVTRYCTELDRDHSGPYALYVLCSPDAPEAAARAMVR